MKEAAGEADSPVSPRAIGAASACSRRRRSFARSSEACTATVSIRWWSLGDLRGRTNILRGECSWRRGNRRRLETLTGTRSLRTFSRGESSSYSNQYNSRGASFHTPTTIHVQFSRCEFNNSFISLKIYKSSPFNSFSSAAASFSNSTVVCIISCMFCSSAMALKL